MGQHTIFPWQRKNFRIDPIAAADGREDIVDRDFFRRSLPLPQQILNKLLIAKYSTVGSPLAMKLPSPPLGDAVVDEGRIGRDLLAFLS